MAKKIKICLDAGHYGKYNQSPVNKKYYESDMAWKLHNYLKAELTALGFEVITTRITQSIDLDVYKRGKKAKGCDLFLSLHSNAAGTEKPDYAVACCQIDDDKSTIDEKSEAIGRKLAPVVNTLMGSKENWQIYEKMGNYNKDYYGVLRGAKEVGVPGVLMEHGFHTNKANTKWLLKDANLKKLAKIEAQALAEYFGVKIVTTVKPSVAVKVLYRVRKSWADASSQLGAFSILENAKDVADKTAGYKVFDNNGKVVYEPKANPTVNYFKACTYKGSSFVDALKSIGANTSFSYRSKIANKNGITLYVGLASQNTKLLNLLKKGKLVKP